MWRWRHRAGTVNGSVALCLADWHWDTQVLGQGEHTFPGQLAAQGCRELTAERLTLVEPGQTGRNLERQRRSRICALKELGNIMCSCLTIYHSK